MTTDAARRDVLCTMNRPGTTNFPRIVTMSMRVVAAYAQGGLYINASLPEQVMGPAMAGFVRSVLVSSFDFTLMW